MPRDINQLAKSITDKATREKNLAAVTLGRLGGLKGGPARKAKLTPQQRRKIAIKAATARWSHLQLQLDKSNPNKG